jgi:hypothetical protein
MRAAVLFIAALAAGCPGKPPPPPLMPAKEPDPPAPQLSPTLPPLRTLTFAAELRCPRADASLPDQAAPDPVLVTAIVEYPWCFQTGGGIRRLTFTADGGLTMIEHDDEPQRRGEYALCWGLIGDEIAISGVPGAWEVWHVNYYDQAHAGHPTLEFRNQPHVPCRPPPPREWED